MPQYQNSGIKRNQEAAVLQLSSYDWSFDIVPCFITTEDFFGRTYYLIPDGQGHWKKTDPRIDQNRTTTINQNNSGNVLNIIRIIKYWNARNTMPTISSYVLEVLILNYYLSRTDCQKYVDLEIPNVLDYIANYLPYPISDPKNIVSDINSTSYVDREKVAKRAREDAIKSREARVYEVAGEIKKSIDKWREIFGWEFPYYE